MRLPVASYSILSYWYVVCEDVVLIQQSTTGYRGTIVKELVCNIVMEGEWNESTTIASEWEEVRMCILCRGTCE